MYMTSGFQSHECLTCCFFKLPKAYVYKNAKWKDRRPEAPWGIHWQGGFIDPFGHM